MKNPFVRPPSVRLPESDGKKTLRSTIGKGLYLGEGCEHLGDYISPSAPPVEEFIGELVQTSTSKQIFNGFGFELNKLSHTPAQLCDLAVLLCKNTTAHLSS